MVPTDPIRFAVIADAHFHDPGSDFGFPGFSVGAEALTIRPLADVARSPRLYNEAAGALRFALGRIVAEGISDVILLGDYSDDGQAETLRRLEAMLDEFRARHGLRFFAVPGNHDIFGSAGRHRRKRYLAADGTQRLVTSDPAFEPERAARTVSEAMYCAGYPENLPRDCGFFGAAEALHWETPFGTDPDPQARRADITGTDGTVRRLMDASYLVEPHPGHWWVMIDANVFVPSAGGDDGLADSTSAGWKSILRHRRYLFDWLADVARRANKQGKQLIAFSHYPLLDPLDGTVDIERAMMAETSFHARIPPRAVADAFAATGIALHFSGHVHVNDTAVWHGEDGAAFTNIAVPALVAFPPAYKRVSLASDGIGIETIEIGDMPLDPLLMEAYRIEAELNGTDTGAMGEAVSYGQFANAHLGHITGRRFLKREWPRAVADLFRNDTLAGLLARAGYGALAQALPDTAGLSGVDFLSDWYRLRTASDLAFPWIGEERLTLYRAIAASNGKPSGSGASGEDEAAHRLQLLFQTLGKHLGGHPTRAHRIYTPGGKP